MSPLEAVAKAIAKQAFKLLGAPQLYSDDLLRAGKLKVYGVDIYPLADAAIDAYEAERGLQVGGPNVVVSTKLLDALHDALNRDHIANIEARGGKAIVASIPASIWNRIRDNTPAAMEDTRSTR